MKLAEYILRALLNQGYRARKNPGAITIVVDQIPLAMISNWQLATGHDSSQIMCMPGITQKHIDLFIADLKMLINLPEQD